MRFRFCGGLDAPDWLLAEVSVLSKMSAVRVTLICRQVMGHILGAGLDHDKIGRLTQTPRLSFQPGDVKAMIAALHFVFASAGKYDVDRAALLGELMQLGLPQDISTAVCKEYAAHREELRERLREVSFSFPRLAGLPEWRVDYVISSSRRPALESASVRVRLPLTGGGGGDGVAFEMSAEKFRVLHADLKAARALMDV